MGEWDEAEKQYDDALKLSPDFPNVLHDFAIFLWRCLDDAERAKTYIERALKFEPGDPVRLSNYANFYWEVLKDLRTAQTLFENSIIVPCSTFEPYRQFGLFAHYELLDAEMANELYFQAQQLGPSDVVTLVNRANLSSWVGDNKTASELLQRALASDDQDLNVLGALAAFYWTQEIDIQRAAKYFDAAIAIIPRLATQKRYYANLLGEYGRFIATELGDLERGEEMILKGASLLPSDPAPIALLASFHAFQRREPRKALALLEDEIERLGEQSPLLAAKANIVSIFEKDFPEAERLYRTVLRLETKSPTVLVNLSGLLLAEGNSEEGLSLCRRALNIARFSHPEIGVEGAFYMYSHSDQADREFWLPYVKTFVLRGARSIGWDLSQNVDRAKSDGHPHADLVERLASVITMGEDPAILESWKIWSTCPVPSVVPIG